MKREILMLIIGILIGAIIATGVFLVLQNTNSASGDATMMQGGRNGENDGEMPDMDGNFAGEMPSDLDTTNTTTE